MIEHIEKLLLKHDCVIIPGLGGLVVNYRSACFVPEKNLFMPPARRTGFNVHLTYNDGLLAQSFMQEQACPYEAAMKQIDEQVQVILSKLKTGRPLQLGKIGVLSIDKSNRIVFEPDSSAALTPAYYGLEEVYCLPGIQRVQPVTFSRFVWHSAAVIVLFLLFLPVNVFDKHQVPEQAAVLNLDWSRPPVIVEELKDSCNSSVAESFDIEPDSVFVVENQEDETFEQPVPEEVVEPKIEQLLFTVKPGETYHIIIASLPNEKLANQYLQEVKEFAFDDISIVKVENRYRISVKGFSEKYSAESFLEEFKTNYTSFSSAWIFVDKKSL